jgi:trimethylamine:corrinoid methyltransferase-like protein
LWLPDSIWTRQPYATWNATGRMTMAERARQRVTDILARHEVEPLDEALARELDRIAACAQRELGG